VLFIKSDNGASEFKMNRKIQEIREKLAKLEKEADELKQLKSDYHHARQFRRMLVRHEVD
jgi:cell shape-determining protein MreC